MGDTTRRGTYDARFNPNVSRAMSEDERDMFYRLAEFGPREDEIAEQYALSNELRKTPAPGMRQAGRLVIAANPLEHLGAGLMQYQGITERQDAIAKQKKLAGEIRDAIYRGRGPSQQELGGGYYFDERDPGEWR